MATIVLTDEQATELVVQLPPERKRFIVEALKAEIEPLSGPEVVDKEGLLVVRAPLLQDISEIVEQERKAGIATLLADIQFLPEGV